MPLESLLDLVETLRARIDSHGSALRQSEALTRYALIDPLLRELGWDTSDPGMVIPEYRSGAGSADYALISNSSPAMMVEAKKLGTPLRDQVLAQGINYCLMEGTGYFSVTDGQHWEIYETHKPVPIDEKRVVSWDLKEASPAEVCLKALALWRPSVQSGHVATGQTPVASLTSDRPETTPPQPIPTAQDEHEWQSLTGVQAGKGAPAPVEVLLPDDSRVPITSWVGIPEAAVSWLLQNSILDASHCPIPRAKRHLLSTRPFQPDGRSMTHKKIGSLFMGSNYSASDQIKNTCIIIEHVGQDPAQFKVRFS